MAVVLAVVAAGLVAIASVIGSGHVVVGATLMALALVLALAASIIDAERRHLR